MPTLILALNPAIDAEWRVDDVLWEEKNLVQSENRWAGGKGVNVARWLKHHGGKPLLVLSLGGNAGVELAGYVRGENLPAKIVHLRESTRVNVVVTTAEGRQMRFNAPGPELSRSEWREVCKIVRQELARADFLVLSGSLPRGAPLAAYGQFIRLAHRAGVKSLLDCDGPALGMAVKARPFLVKPNEHELAQWWGRPLRSEFELVRAARDMSARTRGWVFVSRGAERGLLVNAVEDFACFAAPPRVKLRNTVGAGDALLAAVVRQIQLGRSPQHWLRAGLQAGSAAAQCVGGRVAKQG